MSVIAHFLVHLSLAAAVLVAAMVDARAQTGRQVPSTTVTIMTDGVVEPGGMAAQAINELAETLGRAGKLRVLPVAGLGAANNVRELLYLPGIDLAILNSDIFAYLDLNRQYPEGRRRIRHVVQLFDQQVYLIARKTFKSIGELQGRRVLVLAAGGGGHVTATTVFGLQGIGIKLETMAPGQVLDDAHLAGYDGMLLLSGEFPRVRLGEQARQDFHLLSIPLTQSLLKVYPATRVAERDLAGFSHAGPVDTIAVSTLLASFDWSTGQNRYANVATFIQGMFAALPALRNQYVSWRQVAPEALPPGWTRYAAARPRETLGSAQLAEFAKLERPPLAQPVSAIPSRPAPAAKRTLKVFASARAPLADERLPDGGLIGSLLRKSLSVRESAGGNAAEIAMQWTRALPPPVETVLDERTVDISIPFEAPDCERPNDLTQTSAVLCDNAIFSDPIIQVVIGLFRLTNDPNQFDADEKIFGKTICLPQDRDASVLNANGRSWIAEKRVTVVRQPSLVDCLGAVQKREADAFVASDLETRYVLNQLGLAPLFSMAERPLGTHGVHAVVSRNHARAGELIDQINAGLRRLKQSDAYAGVVREHISRLWADRTGGR